MSEPCEKGDLISGASHFTNVSFFVVCINNALLIIKVYTEYVGELIFEPTFHSRE